MKVVRATKMSKWLVSLKPKGPPLEYHGIEWKVREDPWVSTKPITFTAFTTFIIWMLTEQRYTITSNARLLEQAIEVPLLACVVVCMIDQSQKTILVASWCVCKRNIHIVIHAIRIYYISCMLASWLSRVYAWTVCVYIHIIYNTTQASSGTFIACLMSLALAVIMLLFRKHLNDKSGESGKNYKSCRFVTT